MVCSGFNIYCILFCASNLLFRLEQLLCGSKQRHLRPATGGGGPSVRGHLWASAVELGTLIAGTSAVLLSFFPFLPNCNGISGLNVSACVCLSPIAFLNISTPLSCLLEAGVWSSFVIWTFFIQRMIGLGLAATRSWFHSVSGFVKAQQTLV